MDTIIIALMAPTALGHSFLLLYNSRTHPSTNGQSQNNPYKGACKKPSKYEEEEKEKKAKIYIIEPY